MRTKNDIMNELMDTSRDYERLCREINVKKRDLKDYAEHIEELRVKKDTLGKKIEELHKELCEMEGLEDEREV